MNLTLTIVLKYDGNKHIGTFTYWNQMLCMVFGQLATRDSLCRNFMLYDESGLNLTDTYASLFHSGLPLQGMVK